MISAPADVTHYIGNELELFDAAKNWKAYFAERLRSYIKGNVAEVGAGIGGTTIVLCTGRERSWTCIEPDPHLGETIRAKIVSGELQPNVSLQTATLAETDGTQRFDTIVYIDVLEHIEHDKAEIDRAGERLAPGGHLIVLSPAHQSLFTEFDAAIGHYRRYSRMSLTALRPHSLALVRCFYLDSVGLFASLANKLLLKQSQPRPSQIAFWDQYMVPISRITDPLLGYALGKTVIGVWRKPA